MPTVEPKDSPCWSKVDYWRTLCPQLSLSDGDDTSAVPSGSTNQSNCDGLQQRLIEDGYALIDEQFNSSATRQKVAEAITDLETHHSLPATFVLLYDETWHLAMQSHRLLLHKNNILHNQMSFNFDVLAWHIDPLKNQVGFSPHRDRQPETVDELKNSFYEDGQAKYVTHWIALTDANPNNSCLYVIPKQFDPGYLQGDDTLEDSKLEETDNTTNIEGSSEQFADPLSRALPTKQSYQNIRALPRQPGQSIIFTHRILHWGSAGNPSYQPTPRIAISFVYSDADYEAPYLTSYTINDKPPPFALRLLLVCSQLLIYYQRFELSTPYLRACYDYVKQYERELNEVYRKKVYVEFVKAMKERRVETDDAGIDNGDNNLDATKGETIDEGNSSEDEDAMLEAMLENEDEFEDDFDDLEYEKNDRKRPRISSSA